GRIGPCVSALRRLADEVVVVDDGSGDRTASEATLAGATVLRTPRRKGKGGALEGALRRLGPADVWLLADRDPGATPSSTVPVSQGGVGCGEARPPPPVPGADRLPCVRAAVRSTRAHVARDGGRAAVRERVRGRDRDDARRGPWRAAGGG